MRYQVYAPMYNSETDKVEMVCIAMFNRIAFVSMFTSTYMFQMKVTCVVKEVRI